MLYNGEEVGNGARARGRRRRRPARGHAADRARPAERDRRDRGRRARDDVLPRRGGLHGQDRRRARRRSTRSTSTRRRPRTSRASREAKGKTPREVDVVVLERERHEALIAELREAGAKVRLIRDGDVAPAIAAAQPRHRRRPARRDRRHAGGRDLGRGAQVRRRRRSRASSGRATTTSGRQLVDAGSTSTACCTTDDLVAGEDVFVAATGVTDGALLHGVRYTARRRRSPTRSSCARARARCAAIEAHAPARASSSDRSTGFEYAVAA